ncbi:YciI family protein [Thalassotalea profundi]|uniref:YCII-related domain-containing protein n=1 Tax=Thalassotalea profundi TaxID=2036687 RepID=A0ABQ3J029_9GAMM|nr:YciI family protein [Thalassotalea profundi]GHE99915.1 hypothetical protein GCM10011501_31640 [Thalassotalea profundi]
MKFINKMFVLVCLITAIFSVNAQEINPRYDQDLAERLGADEYGMKRFIFVILKSGSNVSQDSELRNEAFSGHLANIKRLVKEDKLIVAGPFGKNADDYRGLFILNVKTINEAKKLLETDPAIKANYLVPALYNWYGSAALSEYLDASDKVWKITP